MSSAVDTLSLNNAQTFYKAEVTPLVSNLVFRIYVCAPMSFGGSAVSLNNLFQTNRPLED